MATAASDTEKKDAGPKKATLYSMVLQALSNNKTSKGLTIQSIKKAVIQEHPETQENFSNKRLRTALSKGLATTEIIRPKSSEQEGMKGYFILNRVLAAQKAKKKKTTKTASTTEDGSEVAKPKKPKSVKKDDKSGKSKDSKAVKSPKPKKTTKPTAAKVAKKKPLTAKASNSSSKKTPVAKKSKKRDSIVSTPKSRADRTKAGTTASKRRFLN